MQKVGFGRFVLAGTFFLILLAGLFLGSLYILLTKSLPKYQGTYYVEGLSLPTEIDYDEFAAPHIKAKNMEDLFYAQGFAHARDRLWQMDIYRRLCEGTLSEVLGEESLDYDKFSRTVGFHRISIDIWEKTASRNDTTKSILESYARGVNAYLKLVKDSKESLPIEFAVLQYEPKLWKPEHSLGLVRMMAWALNLSWHIDITMAEVAIKVGQSKVLDLYPEYPVHKPIVMQDIHNKKYVEARKSNIHKDYFNVDKEEIANLRSFLDDDIAFRNLFGYGKASHYGSNGWVVSGQKMNQKGAILANDPHLQLTSPSNWMDMTLSCSSKNFMVSGASLPGVPLVALGKNDSIAWGITSMMLDDCDFFIWKDSDDFYNGNYSPEKIEERIYVEGKVSPEVIEVEVFDGGVIIPDKHVSTVRKVKSPILEKYKIGMRWTGLEPTNEILAFYMLAFANNWVDFRDALKDIGSPGQNFIYADAEGNIGYQAAAIVPIRKNKHGGLLRNPTYDFDKWDGYVPFEQLPSMYNPPSGIIVTANNKIVSDTYPYFLTSHWEPPSRSERILDILKSKQELNEDDFRDIQNDVISPFARDVIQHVLPIILKSDDLKGSPAVQLLKNWDYSFQNESVAALIYTVFFNCLLQETLLDELGETLFKNYLTTTNVPTRAMYDLLQDTLKRAWFDNINTPFVETREDIILKSLRSSIAILERKNTKNMNRWFWGDAHTLTPLHFFSNSGNAIGKLFNLKTQSTSGTSTTVNNGEHRWHPGDELKEALFPQVLGASSRRIIDLTKKDGTYLSVLPGGNSGHVWSPYYDDQMKMWQNGLYRLVDVRNISNKEWKRTRLLPQSSKKDEKR